MKNALFILIAGVCCLYGCNTNNVTQDNSLKKYFDEAGAAGTFGIFDNAQGQFTVYNLGRFRDSAYLPASTFKIVNSLAALGTGVLFSDTVVVPWDGVVRMGPGGDTMHAWNKDMDMRQAFEVSNVGFYQEMARRIGKDTMQMLLDSIGYGRRYDTFRITNNLDRFWLDNSLKVSPDEQLGLVKRLYFRQLPFQNREQEIVRTLMIRERNDKYILAYKTGWGQTERETQLGWVVGWIEENKHVYPFVLNLESPDTNFNMVEQRMKILRGILGQLGFFEGRK
ncbi:MAG TPA: penicillin-binding transpeptidase domain-containing protein [Phnomibacter sp.]|nr:penicillin-binding transpeptidase domain-containing protein [Phnomibacter sp.]